MSTTFELRIKQGSVIDILTWEVCELIQIYGCKIAMDLCEQLSNTLAELILKEEHFCMTTM